MNLNDLETAICPIKVLNKSINKNRSLKLVQRIMKTDRMTVSTTKTKETLILNLNSTFCLEIHSQLYVACLVNKYRNNH